MSKNEGLVDKRTIEVDKRHIVNNYTYKLPTGDIINITVCELFDKSISVSTIKL